MLRCAEHGYTLHAKCPACGVAPARAGPAKYSPEDTFGKYRRQLKVMDRAKQKGDAS